MFLVRLWIFNFLVFYFLLKCLFVQLWRMVMHSGTGFSMRIEKSWRNLESRMDCLLRQLLPEWVSPLSLRPWTTRLDGYLVFKGASNHLDLYPGEWAFGCDEPCNEPPWNKGCSMYVYLSSPSPLPQVAANVSDQS